MVILFIYRLIQVYKKENNNEILVGAITKSIILVSISISVTSIDLFATVLYRYVSSYTFAQWVIHYVALFDVYTNFICVIFCYKSFKGYYTKICSCMDNKCRVCWDKVIVDKSENTVEKLENRTNDHRLTVEASTRNESVMNYRIEMPDASVLTLN